MAHRNLNKGSKVKLSNHVIVIPLHVKHDFMTDYVVQTSKILKKQNQVILFDFRFPYSWKDLIINNELRQLYISLSAILKKSTGTVYFRPLSLFPFQSIPLICNLNKKAGVFFLNLLLLFKKRKKIVWRFYPVLDFGVKPIKNARYVYDCIDCLSEEKRTKSYFSEEKKIWTEMDVLAFNSRELMEIKEKHYPEIGKNIRVETICGCDARLFSRKPAMLPPELTSRTRKMAVLAGHIDYRIDFKLLEFIVRDNPSVDFMIIGPVDDGYITEFRGLSRFRNFIYVGTKLKSELPSYFHTARVGIIPYLTKYNFVRYSNPMKAYEYISAGIPVVSTEIAPLKNLPDNIVFCSNDPRKFSAKLRSFIGQNRKNFKHLPKIAEKHDWEHKVKTITNKIADL